MSGKRKRGPQGSAPAAKRQHVSLKDHKKSRERLIRLDDEEGLERPSMQVVNPAVLSDELQSALGGNGYGDGDGANALVMQGNRTAISEARKGGKKVRVTAAEIHKARALKRAKQRKAEVYEQKKEKIRRRDGLIQSIKEHTLSNDQLQLLESSRNLGRSETMREKLKRALNERKAGLQSSADVQLLKERTIQEYNEWVHSADETGDGMNTDMVASIKAVEDKVRAPATEDEEARAARRARRKRQKERARKRKATVNKTGVSFSFGWKAKKKDSEDSDESDSELSSSDESEASNDSEADEGTSSTRAQKKADNEEEEDDEEDTEKARARKESAAQPSFMRKKGVALTPDEPGYVAQSWMETEEAKKREDEDKSKVEGKKASYVLINRTAEVEAQRSQLPIIGEEQRIMETLTEEDAVIVVGETGSGKTTQMPQMLVENGYLDQGKLIITQPRRVAAMSTARRVAHEMNSKLGKLVGYQVRFDSKTSSETQVSFVTDGVLLRLIQQDFLLADYSVVLLDEAHERGINTDILIGLLSRSVKARRKLADEGKTYAGTETVVQPLKLVIMSATLQISDFTENTTLFPQPPPVLQIEARQYPVSIHYARHTREDYCKEAIEKVAKIHRRLPPGAVLVFLPSQDDIEHVVRTLAHMFPGRDEEAHEGEHVDVQEDEADFALDAVREGEEGEEEEEDDEEDGMVEDDGEEGEERVEVDTSVPALHVLPLFSMLAPARQEEVFAEPPAGKRLVVVSTNVAETSLTIPGIRYVVDSGKVKERSYDQGTGINKFVVNWISQASAKQRAGRAGRTGPGHAYALYSAAVAHEEMVEHRAAEILRMPIESIVLQMKLMGIDRVREFPFPTPPNERALDTSVRLLTNLGALDADSEELTATGKAMAKYPVSPRFAKMLMLSAQHKCEQYVVAMVAALTVGSPIIHAATARESDVFQSSASQGDEGSMSRGAIHKENEQWLHGKSDLLGMLRAIGAASYSSDSLEEFCQNHFLRLKAMREIQMLRGQLVRILNEELGGERLIDTSMKMKPPSKREEIVLRQILLAGFIDHVARRVRRPEEAVHRPHLHPYRSAGSNTSVYLHVNSSCVIEEPRWVVYHELVETSRPYMHGNTVIEPEWIGAIAPATLCRHSRVLDDPAPRWEEEADAVVGFVQPSFGLHGWKLPLQQVNVPDEGERYSAFALALLRGRVLPKLKGFCRHANLSTSSMSMMKLVAELSRHKVDSRAKLLALWDGTWLRKEMAPFIGREHHAAMVDQWADMAKVGKSKSAKNKGKAKAKSKR